MRKLIRKYYKEKHINLIYEARNRIEGVGLWEDPNASKTDFFFMGMQAAVAAIKHSTES